MMEKALLQVEEVTKRFGGLTAVNQVSMHVKQGETVGLIGANGAGVTFKEKPKADTVDNLARRKMMFERRRQQKTVAGSQMDIALAPREQQAFLLILCSRTMIPRGVKRKFLHYNI